MRSANERGRESERETEFLLLSSSSSLLCLHRPLVPIRHRLSPSICQISFFSQLCYSLFFSKVAPREQYVQIDVYMCVCVCVYIYIYNCLLPSSWYVERKERRCHTLFVLSLSFSLWLWTARTHSHFALSINWWRVHRICIQRCVRSCRLFVSLTSLDDLPSIHFFFINRSSFWNLIQSI